MKYIKIILVTLVILGLVLSYVIFGFRSPKRIQAPTTSPKEETPAVDFKGPTAPPSVEGPSGPPPTE